ncbi:MAG: UDP-N-acetylmuramate--L-alanine ligase [Gammaproteobacteria bacterium]|nr:UDP-N-acetylmuramate--L-alanine ligase [Gammaproteobacteria bacterium]
MEKSIPVFHSPKMGRIKQIHFIGIGGAGMCGIAEVLFNEGYQITGSDLTENKVVTRLRALGIVVFIGHAAENVENADVVVRSTAVQDDNPEVIAARDKSIPVIPRAAMLAELMRFRHGIAIAGTHGKTTTTSLVTSLLAAGGLDPSFVVGGKLNKCGSNAQLGTSQYFVVEADESDASFLFLKPMMAVVTNIDADHMGTYQSNFDQLRKTFLEFLHHLPFYGLAIVCLEDHEVRRILPSIQRPTLTYGFREGANYRAVNWVQEGLLSTFEVQRPAPHKALTLKFNWPGRHNVLNALAAVVIATELRVDDQSIIDGLYQFEGVGRRFQILGERDFTGGKALIVDDYGHHPREIKATIDAFRAVWPDKRLIHVFQPHRFSRTRDLFNDFVDALKLSDQLLLFDVFSAGEDQIPGINSDALCHEINETASKAVLVNEDNLEDHLNRIVSSDDVILVQGAGSISQIIGNLIRRDESV